MVSLRRRRRVREGAAQEGGWEAGSGGDAGSGGEEGLERGEPRYIIDLIKRVVTASLRTVDIIGSMPPLTF